MLELEGESWRPYPIRSSTSRRPRESLQPSSDPGRIDAVPRSGDPPHRPHRRIDDDSLDDLEKKLRDRKVRVDERLEILRLLAEPDADVTLRAKQDELLRAVREASNRLKGTAG